MVDLSNSECSINIIHALDVDGTLGITEIDHGGEELRQYQHLHPSAPSDTAEWVEMVVLPYLVVTITELSHVTWHSLVNYHDKHYVTTYRT